MSLSSSDIYFYLRNGYLVISSLLTDDEKKIIFDTVNDFEHRPEVKFKWMHYYEPHRVTGEKLLCRIENFIPYSPELQRITCGSKLMSAISQLMGEDCYLYKDKINFKYPGGGSFKSHQDCGAFQFNGVKNHITVLIAVDPMTEENGCLEIAINQKEIWQTPTQVPHTNEGEICSKVSSTLEFHPLVAKPGDVIFFGSYIPHRSGPNNTSHSRRTLYLTYNPISEGDKYDEYFKQKREEFPPDNERIAGKDYSEGAKVFNLANPIKHFD